MNKQPILNLEEVDRFKNMLAFARSTVEGYFTGRHKSPDFGSAAEFAEYREYVAGEDVGRIDWRVYGRTGKVFVKQYEEETDMVVYLVVDISGSMRYERPGVEQKYRLAAKIAAALAYLMMNQGDKVSLSLFDSRVWNHLPPSGTRRHLYNLLSILEGVKPGSTTSLGRALAECTSLFRKRGRLVIISDFQQDHAEVLDSLNYFLHRKFEVLLMQVLDEDELQLPQVDVARFQDMETGQFVQVEPDEIRGLYRETMQRQIDELSRNCRNRQVEHAVVKTDNPYVEAIEAYLGFGSAGGASNQ